jgi:ATP-dependent DNA helicase RecG
MVIPAWADEQLSRDLRDLRARGEGQQIEFKEEFPSQASDLAKEIAAFATSNGGTLFIGVGDNGDLVGLPDCESSQARDALVKRFAGICCGSVKPAVTPAIAWAFESDKVVLVITVPKGSEPIYYSQGKPYLRHVSTSRPAEPHEVVGLVRRYLEGRASPGEAEESLFYSELGSILHRVLLWAETPEQERRLSPWFQEWRAAYAQAASELMYMAAKEGATRFGLAQRLREVADSLTEVSTFRATIGSGAQLEEVANRAKTLVSLLKLESVDKLPVNAEFADQIREQLKHAARRMADLRERTRMMVGQGRTGELQAEVGEIGSELVESSFYDLRPLGDQVSNKLRELGMRMRLLEVATIYPDGGASLQRIIDEVHDCACQLNVLAT